MHPNQPVRTMQTVQLYPALRNGRVALPANWPRPRRLGMFRKCLAALLSAQLATMVGCGSLGGLPSVGMPWAQPTTSTALSVPSPQVNSPYSPTDNALANKLVAPPQHPTARGDSITPLAALAGEASLAAAVVPVAYETPVSSTATGETLYNSRATISDSSPDDGAYVLSGAQLQYGPQDFVPQHCAPCATEGGCNCGAADPAGNVSGERYRNAQEYIFDGGDQQPTVIIKKDWTAAGVDPTDTVIYYETLAGSVCVQPTNRVPIYAPRFGAVRQVSGLQLATHALGTERILAPVSVERFDENNLAGTVVQPVAPHGEQQVGLIDAFQENYVAPPLEQIQPLYRMSAARVPFELIDPTRTGLITREELVDIQQFIQNAQAWVTPESLAVEISNQAAILVKDTKAAQDLFVYELPDKCAMRICKAASHTIANSGDIVSFSIRFDNAGVKPLGNAVIIDNLPPRLNYINGSQQCSVGVRFSAEPNDVGSMVLRWEIEEAIEPSDGGVISFDCRVR